jgi:hypothetical protein
MPHPVIQQDNLEKKLLLFWITRSKPLTAQAWSQRVPYCNGDWVFGITLPRMHRTHTKKDRLFPVGL